jgi:butyryl-CoA dehydrogenase
MTWFYAANTATTGYSLLTIGNANLLLAHGSPEQIDRFVRPMIAGRFTGTMALSEPHAGSNLADITTRAEPQDDGTYRIFGQKMWISGGDHEIAENIVHLVLAKMPGSPAGTRGISLFIVPKFVVEADGSLGERNDVVLSGLNHKMGYRGTVNTAPTFGSGAFRPSGQPGAIGYLVGEPNRGLPYMFHMMNEARMEIGLSATALGYTGYLKSLDYARNRPQGRTPANPDPTSPQVAIVEHTDVRRMLLAQKSWVEGALALSLYVGNLLDEAHTNPDSDARAAAQALLDVLTPIAKSWPSQWCLEANNLAIQVLGGAGYTRDYDVEQHYRDNRLNPIHEGTHGIQALDLLGRKILGGGGAGAVALRGAIVATIERATSLGGEAAELGAQLQVALDDLVETTGRLAALGAPERILANASVYLEAAGHVVIAWMWLEQWLAAVPGQSDFHDGKRQAARYFFRWELPRTAPQFALLRTGDDTTLTMRNEWF